MAQTIILFQARIESDQASAALAALKDKLVQNRISSDEVTASLKKADAARKIAHAEMQKGATGAKEQYEKLTAEILALEQAQKANKAATAEVNKEVKNINAGKGSITEMRKDVADLTKQWVLLSEAERNSTEGVAFKANMDAKRNKVFALEQAMGQSQRNVGNYFEGFQKFAAQTGFGENISGIFDTVNGVAELLAGLGKKATQETSAVAGAVESVAGVAVESMASTLTAAESATVASSGGIISGLGGVGVAASGAAIGVAAVGVAAVAAFGIAAKNSVAYADTLKESEKITGQTAQKLDELARKSTEVDLGKGVKVTSNVKDIAELQQAILSADATLIDLNGNLNESRLIQETNAAVILSNADATLTAKDAAVALTSTLKQYGIEGDKSMEVTNMLAAGAKFGDQSISQSLEGIRKAAPGAKMANVDLSETIALTQSFATIAGGSSEAGTQLQNVFMRLGGAMPQDGLAALRAGLEANGGSMEKLMDTTLPLNERLKELSKIEGNTSAINAAFEGSNAAVVGGLINMGKAADGSKESLNGVKSLIEGNQVALEQARIEQEKSAAAWENLSNRVNNALTSVELATFLDTLSGGLASALDGVINFIGGFFGEVSDAFSELWTAMQPLRDAFGAIGSAISKMFGNMGGGNLEIMKTLGQYFAGTFTVGIRGAALAIKLLTSGFAWAKDKFTDFFGELDTNSTTFKNFEKSIKDGLKKIGDGFEWLLSFSKPIKDFVSNLFGNDPKKGTADFMGGMNVLASTTAKSLSKVNESIAATGTTAKVAGNHLKDLKAQLEAAKIGYSNLVADGKADSAQGKAAKQRLQDLQAELKGIEDAKNAAKPPSDAKAKKDAKENPIKGSLDAFEKSVSELESKLQNTEFGSKAFDKIKTDLIAAKSKLADFKKQYDALFVTPQQQAVTAATDRKASRDEAVRSDTAQDTTGDAQVVEKLRLLENERQYQSELVAIHTAGTKEYKDAEIALSKAQADIRKETATVAAADEKAENDRKKAEQKAAFDAKKQALDEGLLTQKESLDTQLASETITDVQHKDRQIQLEIEYWKAVGEIADAGGKEKLAAQNKVHDLEQKALVDSLKKQKAETKAAEKQLLQGIKTVGQEVINIAKDFVQVETNEKLGKLDEQKDAELAAAGDNAEKKAEINARYAEKKSAIEKEQGEKQKVISIAQAVMNGALAVTNILATVPKFDGGILTGVLIAAAVATTSAQIALISSQKFERGGMISGPSHAGGGVTARVAANNSTVELEGGEATINKKSMMSQPFRNVASWLNVKGGGVAFGSDVPSYVENALTAYQNGVAQNAYMQYRIPSASNIVLMQYQSQNVTAEITNRLLRENNALMKMNNELTQQISQNTKSYKTFKSTF